MKVKGKRRPLEGKMDFPAEQHKEQQAYGCQRNEAAGGDLQITGAEKTA